LADNIELREHTGAYKDAIEPFLFQHTGNISISSINATNELCAGPALGRTIDGGDDIRTKCPKNLDVLLGYVAKADDCKAYARTT
jgi:hypothetical protein